MAAKEELLKEDIDVRVVSMPSMELFEQQDAKYKDEILPHNVRARLSIEMASDFGWHKYVGLDGKTMSVNKFGASAPADIVIKNYGFTVENVVKNVIELRQCEEMALGAHDALGCYGVSRTDCILDERNRLWYLETNTIPGMTGTSLLPDAAKAVGITFDELCWNIMEDAWSRC